MRKILIIFVIISTIIISHSNAQSIKRSVMCSFGSSSSSDHVRLTTTFGQPPSSGTIHNNFFIFRQGFQQPFQSGTNGGEGEDDNCGQGNITFDYEVESTDCGEYFNFFYSGIDDGTVSFDWTFGEDGFPQSSTDKDPQGITFSETGLKVITINVMNDSCSFQKSKIINVTSLAFGIEEEVSNINCLSDGDVGIIDLIPHNGTSPFEYEWSTGDVVDRLDNLAAGEYSYTVTDALGCVFSNDVTIIQPDEEIEIVAIISDEGCDDSGAHLGDGIIDVEVSGGVLPLSFLWSNGANSKDIYDLSSGDYVLSVTDAAGCEAIESFTIVPVCEKEGTINNVITPNGDGQNENWVIEGIENFPENEVRIYNRWGSIVYEKTGYANEWIGTTSDGRALPEAAYFYVIELNDENKTIYSGSVTILR